MVVVVCHGGGRGCGRLAGKVYVGQNVEERRGSLLDEGGSDE